MKLAFSTLACPGWTIEQVVEEARRYGYEGIELRLLDGEVIDPVRDAEKVRQAVSLCRERGLEVCALDTSCRANNGGEEERAQNIAALRSWFGLAQEVGVPLLRIFGGADKAQTSEQEVDRRVIEFLSEVAAEAEQAKVVVALETHDAFSSARRVGRILRAVGSKAVGALWDSHHPYRMGESAQEVFSALEGFLVHVHVKDARRKGVEDWQLTLLGKGEVPVREQLEILQQHGYDGYVAVEWEKKWHPEIAEPEVALPQHIQWLRELSYLRK